MRTTYTKGTGKDNFMQKQEDEYILINYQLLEKEREDYSDHKFFSEIIKNTNHLSNGLKHHVLVIIKTLDSENINLDKLKSLSYDGLDSSSSLRALVWKVLLNLLPRNVNEWEATLEHKRLKYDELKKFYIKNNQFISTKCKNKSSLSKDKDPYKENDKDKDEEPSSNEGDKDKNIHKNNKKETYKEKDIDKELDNIINNVNSINNYLENDNTDKESNLNQINHIKIEENNKTSFKENKNKSTKTTTLLKKTHTIDHPLESSNTSDWKNKFTDVDLYEEIVKDTKRTRAYMNFFAQQVFDDKSITGNQILTNILFIFSKEHKRLKYSQGMNEIIAPLLYCFFMDKNPYFQRFIEHDTYYCFWEIMKWLEVWYINNSVKVPEKVKEFEVLLNKKDKDLFDLFKKCNIDFQFFVFRWVSLGFSQEYEIPELIRIWDSAISTNKNVSDFFVLYSVGLLKLNHEFLIKSDFSEIMEFVQEKVCDTDVEKILKYIREFDI
jgi:hypothetical protein